MAILKVARMGHPILRRKARDLKPKEIASAEIRRLIHDMKETMAEYGGIGLAAPQVHHSVQLAVIGFSEDSSRYPDMGQFPLSVFINPKVTVLDRKEQAFWEGCLSIPELRGLVHRPSGIRVDYLDEKGRKKRIEPRGFLATVFQHELDHLAGVLYVDRVRDIRKLAFLDEYRRYWLPEMKEGEIEE